ncbi:GTP pyrophosphokinase [Geothermobacter hydrogeniphilus]|uniref:GTP pyrophosphokinase n=1 Tax=Geothermobacter hydrogeniphilus TaxID=1969733 RepID=A0A2K2HCG8_9BACT|nr:bifunctional (p)ppGpp synthetase/guanosine-3',5'-bis(diphosphate) 3'-pyrophosphohydrolase [Geothermobacter hydrogeniphilus]PNU20941.1 GTP pyrophosphokinase [Geothermobacter hydrogeniphilus]
MVRLDDILDMVAGYHPTADLEPIRKAYVFCGKVHQGQVRLSGEAYLHHPLEVAHILAQLQLDVPSIVTGLLHDTLEDTLTGEAEIRELFGDEVFELVDGVTKIGRMTFKTRAEEQAENFRKMLLAMARDIRVILVKLADRLHNMRTLDTLPPEQQRLIARETAEIYAPLANRMGISWIKNELENLSFRYQEPDDYRDLSARIARRKREQSRYIEEVKRILGRMLKDNGFDGQISGRAKHLFSIYQKMKRQQIDFDQVHDLIAFRIILPSVQDCYAVLGIVHALWKPIPGRFKDYIAMPKANMYQSLHTTVLGPHGERMEIQLRTIEMHRIAEEGIAAHWKYKEGKGAPIAASGRHDRRFAWLRQMLEWQKDLTDSREFLSSVKVDLFPEEVYVFTPNGDVKELPRGSTPVDFAYSIHSDVGNHCSGAKVNGKLVPLKTELHNGDIVEVTTQAGQHPSKDWLKFVRTSKARNKIRHWIKTEQRERSVELGRDLLEKRLRKYGMSLKKVLSSADWRKAWEEFGFSGGEDLLAALGYGKVSLGQIVAKLVPREQIETRPAAPGPLGKVVNKIRQKPSNAIKLQGVEDILVRFAKCCNPLPGDEVIGFITRGRGVTVHAGDCPQVRETDPERRVPVEWDRRKKASRPVRIRVYCENQRGMLAAITTAITNCDANIISANVHSTADHKGVNNFEVDVQDLEHLNRVRQAVVNLKGVYKVERLRG